jgi:hypothetical protein
MQHKINYKRIFTLLGISISIVAIVLYVALIENKVEEYPFIGDWNCHQKESVVLMHLQITDSTMLENGKKLQDYYPEASKLKENTYNLYNGNIKFAKVKELNKNKISFKKTAGNEKTYYCKRIVTDKE